MIEPAFELTAPQAKRPRVRRGGWSWGPVETAKMRFLSNGGGVQSTTMIEMMIAGELPWVDAIITADPGDESRLTYANIDQLEERVRRASNYVQFVRVSKGERLSDSIRRRADAQGTRTLFVSAPFFTGNNGQGRRQCTREFKVEPIERAQRALMGYRSRQRIPAGSAEVWIGFTTDEVVRAGAAFSPWAVHRFPLLERRMSRADCERWLVERGLPVPPKSACVFCPYRSNAEWRALKENDPESWAQALEIDALIRNTPGMKYAEYLHASRKPLAEVDLSTAEERGQGNMLMVCEAGCGL